MKKQSQLPSIIFMVSIFSVSLVLLQAVLPLHNTLFTICALIIVIFNAIITVGLINERGKNG